MKNFNLLSKMCSPLVGSQSNDVSFDCRLTVGSPSGLDAKWMLKLVSVLVLILTIGVGNVWGAEEVMYPNNGSTFNSNWNKTSRTSRQTYAESKYAIQLQSESGGVYGEISSKNTYTGVTAISVKATATGNKTLTLYYSSNNSTWTELSSQTVSKNTAAYDTYNFTITGIPSSAVYIKFRLASSNSAYVYSVTVTTGSVCSNTVTVSQSGHSNATVSLSSTSVTTCGDAASRQVIVSVAPNSCYAGPTDASVITKTGTAASNTSWVSGPTWNGSTSKYDYVYQFAQNASGTVNFAVSLSTKTTYTVNYAKGDVPSGGGSISGSPSDGTKTCGTNMTLPGAVFTTTGYTQTGWSKTNGGSQYAAVGGSYTDDAAQTFYPVWTANTISLTLDKNNNDASGSTSGSASVKYNATALESGTTHATRTGYSIEGYYAEVGCTNKVLTNVGALVYYSGYVSGGKWARTTTPTTLYAKWTLNSYLLTWNLNGGTVTEAGTGAAVDATGSPSSSVSYGAEITAPTVEKEGYTFTGWNADVASTMPAVATTYTAQWTINQYTVTWKSNGATVRTDNNVNHGTAQTPPTISPLPCGDKLMGWTDAVDGAYVHGTSTLYTTATITITGNKTFYAVFADYGE